MQKLIGRASIIVLIILIGWSLMQTGSPKQARELATDQNAINLMSCRACYVSRYYCDKGELPKDVPQLESFILGQPNRWCSVAEFPCSAPNIVDTQNNEVAPDMSYAVSTKDSFTICTNLRGDGEKMKKHGLRYYNMPKAFANYKPGNNCFTLTPPACPKRN